MSPSEYHTFKRLIDVAKDAESGWRNRPRFPETARTFTDLLTACHAAQNALHDTEMERAPEALAGIRDPAEAIRLAREALKALSDQLDRVGDYRKDRPFIEQGREALPPGIDPEIVMNPLREQPEPNKADIHAAHRRASVEADTAKLRKECDGWKHQSQENAKAADNWCCEASVLRQENEALRKALDTIRGANLSGDECADIARDALAQVGKEGTIL